jgi:hypothetical protein
MFGGKFGVCNFAQNQKDESKSMGTLKIVEALQCRVAAWKYFNASQESNVISIIHENH